MYNPSSQRGYVQKLLTDRHFFDQVLEKLSAATSEPAELVSAYDDSLILTERVKVILDFLGSGGVQFSDPSVQRLVDICEHSRSVRSHLQQSEALWRKVFAGFGHPLRGSIEIESVLPGGRCNYVFRIVTATQQFVVRYHDPLGKEFLQRHEPTIAVEAYCTTAELFGQNLSQNSALCPVFPVPDSPLLLPSSASEEKIPLPELVQRRVIVMKDYSIDHFLLVQYGEVRPPFDWRAVATRLASPQGEWHAASSGFPPKPSPEAIPRWATPERIARLMRFPDSDRYHEWLLKRNWIQARVFSVGTKSVVRNLPFQQQDLRKMWEWLVSESSAAMKQSPSLAHLDHTPRNCFIPNSNREQTVVFDFDYVAILDPAYDAGVTLASLIRRLAFDPAADQPTNLLEVVDEFIAKYTDCYEQASRPGSRSFKPSVIGRLITRIRAFAGFALAGGRDEPGEAQGDTVRARITHVATALLLETGRRGRPHFLKSYRHGV